MKALKLTLKSPKRVSKRPAKGTPEAKAMMDAVRAKRKGTLETVKEVKQKVAENTTESTRRLANLERQMGLLQEQAIALQSQSLRPKAVEPEVQIKPKRVRKSKTQPLQRSEPEIPEPREEEDPMIRAIFG